MTGVAGVARAKHLAGENFEPDVTEAAMINDLAFGTPASKAATGPAKRPTRSGRAAHLGAVLQRSGTGR